jgi:2-polyprenyl-3-methyl-5-hydroxy-6-metoxy-1,4-benzoquinol methylase
MKDIQSTNQRKYQSNNVFLQFALRKFYTAAMSLMPDVNTVLDAGCGEGYSAREIHQVQPESDVIGIDLSFSALEMVSNQILNMPIAAADVTKLPFRDNQFDVVVSFEVLEHIPNPAIAVTEYMRVSRDYLLLSVPNEPLFRLLRMARGDDILQLGNHPEHVNHWNLWTFQRFLADQGLTIVRGVCPMPYIWSIVLCRL